MDTLVFLVIIFSLGIGSIIGIFIGLSDWFENFMRRIGAKALVLKLFDKFS